jgi:hypothetical protein
MMLWQVTNEADVSLDHGQSRECEGIVHQCSFMLLCCLFLDLAHAANCEPPRRVHRLATPARPSFSKLYYRKFVRYVDAGVADC